jgi:signal transduction histidine kinase
LKDHLTRLPSAIERERAEARVRQDRREAMRELRESQERLRHAVRARDEFLSIASHELKTPLTTLTLQAESARQLLETPLTSPSEQERLRAKIDGFSQQLLRMTALINNLLEVTRVASGRLTLSLESVDLRAAVDSAVTTLQDSVRRSGSSVTVVGSTSVAGRWDRQGIDSVVINLLSNALKYGDGKPVEIEVDLVENHGRLVVTDHGIGIPTSDQERIFHRFEQAVPEQHFGGFGLGLWVTRQIVEAHGGTIAVASKPKIGSIFTVLLPCDPKELAS